MNSALRTWFVLNVEPTGGGKVGHHSCRDSPGTADPLLHGQSANTVGAGGGLKVCDDTHTVAYRNALA